MTQLTPAADTGRRPASRASTPAPRPTRRKFGHERRRTAYFMLAPAVIHLVWWIGIPVVATIALAFTNYDILAGTGRFVGIDNFRQIFEDPNWTSSIWHTVVITFFTVPVAMAIAVVIAVLLNNKLRGRAWYRTAVFMPHVTATVAISMVWLWMLEPRIGLVNTMLGWVGIDGPAWANDPDYAIWAVIIVTIWKGIGIKMLIYLAALQGLPQDVYEAAELDGASKTRQFFSITLPLLQPATFFVLVISMIGALQVFDQVYILTPQGGPNNSTTVMTYEIYKTAFQQFRMGPAAAQSVVLFAFLLVLTLISRRFTGKEEDVR
ncbi:carbohydrate ABC transporter permease [Streptomyces boninensis]|uniref:carbohydrate ABC transporter permease n=1 Tax=Streptomyces boninensis TaxID=2039455 RepID=UPI003B20E9D1